MKKVIYFSLLSVMAVLSSCSTSDSTAGFLGEGMGAVSVKMNAPLGAPAVAYPVTLYALDEQGDEVTETTLDNESTPAVMTLEEGSYTIVATSGDMEIVNGVSETPLAYGKTTVDVTSTPVQASIQMNYVVSAVDVTLTDIPFNVTDVSVTFDSQYAEMSLTGVYSGAVSSKIICAPTATEGVWKSPTVYVLPSASDNTVMTIELTTSDGVSSYKYTYSSKLQAATPYHFNGTYNGMKAKNDITMSLSMGTWLEDVGDDFEFGKAEKDPTPPGGLDIVKVHSMPTSGSVADGHVVALVLEDNTGLLLSKEQFSKIKSVNAKAKAETYTEGEGASVLTGWQVPTSADATALNAYYTDTSILGVLNSALTTVNSNTLKTTSDYLCNDGALVFRILNDNFQATSTSSTYVLRLVKKVRFVVE